MVQRNFLVEFSCMVSTSIEV